jgi:high-affinity iron transporter
MLATAIIVFREVLEAALVVSIVMAACKGVSGRNFWVGSGVGAGLIGAGVVAAFASAIAAAASGIGQELLNAAILLIAVAMLGWHSIWMSRHGRELAREVGDVGRAVHAGNRPMYALAIAVGAAVLREGSETVLFLYGVATGDDSTSALLLGGGLGMAAGIGVGALLYFGLLSIPMRYLFAVTNWMILLLTAGMAAQAAGFLVQADLLPTLVDPAWDTSSILNDKSLIGKVLHGLIGYESRPSGVQVVFYVAALLTVGLLSSLLGKDANSAAKGFSAGGGPRGVAVIVAGLVVLGLAGAPDARAEFKLRYPNIDYREVEIEHNLSVTFDKKAEANHDVSTPVEIGVGILPFWFVELEGEFSKAPGEDSSFDALTFESYFMLTEPGEYWLDFAIFAEYARAAKSEEADAVELGLLFQKDHMNFLNTLNLFWEKPVGENAENIDTVAYSWQTRYRLNQYFQPGFEIFGEIEDVNNAGSFDDQQFRIGPMFAGSYNLGQVGGTGKVKYEIGYLFGVTDATEDRTLRTRFEYEIPF